ncbi:MAG: acyltransferase, partial [Acidimicrobiales bacterium]|nr:acyltransferase [Acidimicrobiales bacterium]
QFYLVWPALVAACVAATRRRRSRALVASLAGGAALGSIVFMWVTFDPADPTATYMHTLARAHSLLLGAAAAAATPLLANGRLRRGVLARRVAPLGALAAAGIVTAVSIAGHDQASSGWMFRWGHPAFALALVPVVVAAADGAGSRVLAAPAMRWVADRSYGLYLWHWPVFLLLAPSRLGVDGAVATAGLDVVRVAVAVALADVSLRWLESPVRRRRVLLTWRAPVAAATTMVVIAVLAVSLVPGSPASSSAAVVTLPPPPASTSASSAPPSSAPPASTVPSTSATDEPDAARASAGPVPTTTVPATIVDAGTTGPLRVLVTGDSTAVHLSEALIAFAATVPDELLVGSGAFPGCGLTAADDGRMHEFTDTDGSRDLIDLSGCVTQFESVPERVVAEAVDVVLVVIGPWDAVDVHLPDGEVVSVADAAGRRLVSEAYRHFAAAAIGAGAEVVWVTPADAHLGWGEVDDPVNDPARWSVLRGVLDELTVDLGVVQIDLPGWLAANDLSGPEGRPDGIHLGPGLNERFVVDEVIPALAAAHR